VEVSGNQCPGCIENFTDIRLTDRLTENIHLMGYKRPSPVQKYSLPIVYSGRDLMACSQTGSGKTAAFLIPIAARILQSELPSVPSRRKAYPLAVVLAPTRELSSQIAKVAKQVFWKTGLRSTVIYGGCPIREQLFELERGCDILIATPGRLVDVLERGRVSLSQVQYLVLDEADRMLDEGFMPQIMRIVEGEDMPKTGERETLMFSATFSKEIQKLASSLLDDYVFLAVGKLNTPTDLVTQKFIRTSDEVDKRNMLLDLICSVKGLTIIFVDTKKKADILEDLLLDEGYAAISIHGDRSQQERELALSRFASGKRDLLIATDVAARGLHIKDVAHVINYDMPNDFSFYVHRIGRTARIGNSGLATSFITEDDAKVVPKLLDVLQKSNQDIPAWLEGMAYRKSSYQNYPSKPYKPSKFGGKDYRYHANQRDVEYPYIKL
jgi:ATP-dependent RNA helicase DDX3X